MRVWRNEQANVVLAAKLMGRKMRRGKGELINTGDVVMPERAS